MAITARELELMKIIGDGEYGWVLPDDEDTAVILTSLHERGLIGSEQARIDDFLFVTKAGEREMQAFGQSGGAEQ